VKLVCIAGLFVLVVLFVFAVGWRHGKKHQKPEDQPTAEGSLPAKFALTRPALRGQTIDLGRRAFCARCLSPDHHVSDCPDMGN
jgi:hypothetical protein